MNEGPPFSVSVSLAPGADPQPFLVALHEAGVEAKIGPIRIQESAGGGSADVVVFGLRLSRELADTLLAGAVGGVVTTITASASAAIGRSAHTVLQRFITGARALWERRPQLLISCSVQIADKHVIYNVPGYDREAALTMMLDDAATAIAEPPQNQTRFWIYGRWMSGFAPYYEYRAVHDPIGSPLPHEALPAAIAETVPPARTVLSCKTGGDLFIDVSNMSREHAERLLLAVRTRLEHAVVGLDEDRKWIHVEFAADS